MARMTVGKLVCRLHSRAGTRGAVSGWTKTKTKTKTKSKSKTAVETNSQHISLETSTLQYLLCEQIMSTGNVPYLIGKVTSIAAINQPGTFYY